MSIRFDAKIKALKENSKKALVPYVIVGDPNFEVSLDILKTLVKAGADVLNLGFAFSDPGTAGPFLQLSNKRAIDAGSTSNRCFDLIKKFRQSDATTPIFLIMYTNPIVVYGIEKFFMRCKECGVDGVLIADLPYIMYENKMHNFKDLAKGKTDLVLCATTNCSDETLKAIVQSDCAYIYALSDVIVKDGAVGYERPFSLIDKIKLLGDKKVFVGTGINSVDDIKSCSIQNLEGMVLGSAISKIIEENLDNKERLFEKLTKAIKNLSDATYDK